MHRVHGLEENMTKKTAAKKSKNTPAVEAKRFQSPARECLLAQVAGNIAAGVVTAPSDLASSAEAIAAIAVDIAEEILKKAGL